MAASSPETSIANSKSDGPPLLGPPHRGVFPRCEGLAAPYSPVGNWWIESKSQDHNLMLGKEETKMWKIENWRSEPVTVEKLQKKWLGIDQLQEHHGIPRILLYNITCIHQIMMSWVESGVTENDLWTPNLWRSLLCFHVRHRERKEVVNSLWTGLVASKCKKKDPSAKDSCNSCIFLYLFCGMLLFWVGLFRVEPAERR